MNKRNRQASHSSERHAQKIRIRELRTKLDAIPGTLHGCNRAGSGRDLDAEEAFLLRVLAYEDAPETTLAKQLIQDGIELPPPAELSGEALTAKLWEVIRGLARRRTFLYSTNHLSDAELYAHLWEEVLNEPTEELDDIMGDWACHIDLVGNGGEPATSNYLRYFADDLTRRDWMMDFPDYPMPAPQKPPHDRDRRLPKRP